VSGRPRRIDSVVWALLFAALTWGDARGVGVDRSHAWLHLNPTSPEQSTVDVTSLRLDPEREKLFREQRHGSVELLERHEVKLRADGMIETRQTTVRQFLTDDGVRQSGNFGALVRTTVQRLHVEEAWCLLPDGRRASVDLQAVQVLDTDRGDVFSDSVQVLVPFERLQPGAVAVFVTRTVQDLRQWPLPWSALYWPQGMTPLERFELDVSWDPERRSPQLQSDADFVTCETGSGHLSCRAGEVVSAAGGFDGTLWLDVLPQIVVSDSPDWTDLAAAEARLVDESVKVDHGVADAVLRLTAGQGGPREKLKKIHRFVADEIRYVGMEHGVSAVAPATAAHTLKVRYGDCKSKVALFVAMARTAGITAYPVLVSTSRNELSKLQAPSWRYFDHMIACASLDEDADPVCIDLTAPSTATGDLPVGLYGSVALDLHDGTREPRTIPIPAETWQIDVVADNTIRCDGTIEERLRRTFGGPSAAWQRAQLSGYTAEELRHWSLNEYQRVMGEGNDPRSEIKGTEDVDEPVVLVTETIFEGAATGEVEEYVEFDNWMNYYALWFWTDNEIQPSFHAGARIRTTLLFHLCPGNEPRFFGPSLDFRSEFGSLTRSYRHESGTVEVDTVLVLEPMTIRGTELDRYRRFLDTTLAQLALWYRLEAPIGTGEAP